MLVPMYYPVTCHADRVTVNSTFVAVRGFRFDGRDFIPKAIARGARRIVLEPDPGDSVSVLREAELFNGEYCRKVIDRDGVAFWYVENARKALALLAASELGNPAEKLKIIGVTGTKGKTTTAFLIEHILRTAGFKTALLGSNKNKILHWEYESERTTMESDALHMFFAACVQQGVEVVVMEVSSHALALHRTYGISFEAACFTNLAPEHMDFHQTMQHYFATKFRLFDQVHHGGVIVLNGDSTWGVQALRLLQKHAFKKRSIDVFSYGAHVRSGSRRFHLTLKEHGSDGVSVMLRSSDDVFGGDCTSLFGDFNGYNLAMACLVCHHLGISSSAFAAAIKCFPGVPGRLQSHRLRNGARAFVDYAHNPSSLDAVLSVLRTQTSHLIALFGCGGDRDKAKRPLMGQIAAKHADAIVLTNDNPRSEDPQRIVEDIAAGIPRPEKQCVSIILDREKAIKYAVSLAHPHSIVVLLGKGHERYFFTKGERIFFNDFEEISKY